MWTRSVPVMSSADGAAEGTGNQGQRGVCQGAGMLIEADRAPCGLIEAIGIHGKAAYSSQRACSSLELRAKRHSGAAAAY